MRAVLLQNTWEKYAEFGKICAKICGIYVALRKYAAQITRVRVFTLDKMRRNAEKCDRICRNMQNMRIFA